MKNIDRLSVVFLLVALMATACTEKETTIGFDLQDSTTIYNGSDTTISGADIKVQTMRHSNMRTSGIAYGMVGSYNDEAFGTTTAECYAQITTAEGKGIDLSDANGRTYRIDSVVLRMYVSDVYRDTVNAKRLRFVVEQLSDTMGDTAVYSAEQKRAVSNLWADTVVEGRMTVGRTVRIPLGGNIAELIRQRYDDEAAFKQAMRGLSVRMGEGSDEMLLTIDFSNSNTSLMLYYASSDADGVVHDSLPFIVGRTGATDVSNNHYTYFEHNYAGTTLAALATDTVIIDRQQLMLCPMAGTYVTINLGGWVERFREEHPAAVVNYAELILPEVAGDDYRAPLLRLYRPRYDSTGARAGSYQIDLDLLTEPTDGAYNGEGYYRIRITHQLQRMLRDGKADDLLLNIAGRESTARHAVLCGPDAAGKAMEVRVVYSE